MNGLSDTPGRLNHDRRLLVLALGASLPAVAVSLWLLFEAELSARIQWSAACVIVAVWWLCALALRDRAIHPLRLLSNLLAGLREGDTSWRLRGARRDDALGLALLEANALRDTLREDRVGEREASGLVREVVTAIDVAVFAFDEDGRVRMANRAAERLVRRDGDALAGRAASEIGLAACLESGAGVRELAFPGGMGRFDVRVGRFRQDGRPHRLLVLTDLSRALREEERQAWQRLIRVLGHEINNSLAPIRSLASSLQDVLDREPAPPDRDADLREGLSVIASRSAALERFMASYSALAKLPPPQTTDVSVEGWVRRVVGLETRREVHVEPGPACSLRADADQLEQLLINLVRNAVDAVLGTDGSVRIGWGTEGGSLALRVEDEGPGLADTANLFVPFFTTKPEGTGIGLALSRQIAEAHGGSLSLENRRDGPGCVATLRLPL